MTAQAARSGQVPLLPERLYRRALEVGRRAAGVAGPNPPVGCVLVRDGEVVAEGATEPVGGRHAEVVAIDAAGDRARGSVAVVTLEPCAHHGRTPPCTDALLTAGVAAVHFLLPDPDPVAAGGGEALSATGIRVVDVGDALPTVRAAAEHDLRGFLSRVMRGRPHVTLKLAQTPDGRTVPQGGRYLTGQHARRHVHLLRAEADAVLVGGATVRADDPMLDVRHVATTHRPRPVLLSVQAELPVGARVMRAGTVLLHGPAVAASALAALEAAGVRLVGVPLDEGTGLLDLPAALAALLEERILTVLAEPGARLAGALLDAGLVDTVEVHVAAGAGASTVVPALPALSSILDASAGVERTVTSDGDLIVRSPVPAPLHERPVLEGVA